MPADTIQFFTEAIQEELSKKTAPLSIPGGIAADLGSLLRSDEATFGDIARIVGQDPSLTAKLLNLANSSFYSGIVRATTIEQAAARVGIVGVRNLLMTIIFKDVFTCKGTYLRAEFSVNWRHSLSCAVCAKAICEKTGKTFLAQDAYLLGLLHDIGTVAILDVLCSLYKKDESLHFGPEELLVLLGSLHAAAGAQVLGQLSFNEKLCRMVAMHHRPEEYTPREETLFGVLLAADALLKRAGVSLSPAPDLSLAAIAGVSRLPLDEQNMAELEQGVSALVAHVDSLI